MSLQIFLNDNWVPVYRWWTADSLNILVFEVPNTIVKVPTANGIMQCFSNTVPLAQCKLISHKYLFGECICKITAWQNISFYKGRIRLKLPSIFFFLMSTVL